MGVNGKGVWLGCKYAAAQMLGQEPHSSGERGWIINLASVLGLVGFGGTSVYCASKGAVVQIVSAAPYCFPPRISRAPLLVPMRSSLVMVVATNGHRIPYVKTGY